MDNQFNKLIFTIWCERNPMKVALWIAVALLFSLTFLSKASWMILLEEVLMMLALGFVFRRWYGLAIISLLLTTMNVEMINSDSFSLTPHILSWALLFFSGYVVALLINISLLARNQMIEQIETLLHTMYLKDTYTFEHLHKVANYAWQMAKQLKSGRKQCRSVYLGGLLHDIGKLGIPDHILQKPAKLTKEEYAIMKEHPHYGYELLKHSKPLQKENILDMVLLHHERFDGSGYPMKLKQNQIPFLTRIISVADAFDSMTSRRRYKDKNDITYVLNEFNDKRGTQFDPEVTDLMIKMIENQCLQT